MMARSFGSFCAMLLAWLCALGAGPARHPAAHPFVARGAAELALRDVAEVPLVGARAAAARSTSARLLERGAPPAQAPLVSELVELAAAPTPLNRAALERQSAEHAGRSRWRVYDAAAPPSLSSLTR